MYNLLLLLLLPFLFFIQEKDTLSAPNNGLARTDLKVWIDKQFEEGMDSFNIPGATFILMEGDSILHMQGYGVIDIETNTAVNSELSLFGIGSISKTFVGTAIMQLFEEGKLQLDQDINKYLKTFQIDYKFGDPVTIKQLLTHTAGFDERNIATTVRTQDEVISLTQYLQNRMSPQIRPAGEALTYSNHGYALLGLIVEEVSDLPFHEYVTKVILEPLGMNSSDFMFQPDLKENYVVSYLQKDSLLIPYKLDFLLDYPAGSMKSTASDMGTYISMYLNKGTYKGVQILDSTTVKQMHETAFKHFQEADGGWLLGFYEDRWKGLKIVQHGGAVQGFASELMLIPEKNIGLFLSINASSIPASKTRLFISSFVDKLWEKLMPEMLVESDTFINTPANGSVTEPITKFTGTYRFTRYAQTTIDKLAVFIGFAPEVKITANGDSLEIVAWNDKLIPISDLIFYSTKDKKYKAFGRNAQGKLSYFFPSGTSSFHKLKWYEPIGFQIYWVGSIVLILLISIIVSIARKFFVPNKQSHLIRKINFTIAFLIIIFLGHIAYVLITTDPQEFSYGMPLLIKITLVLPLLFIPLTLYSGWLLIKAWLFKKLGTYESIYQSIIVVAAFTFIPWLYYWNLIGFNF